MLPQAWVFVLLGHQEPLFHTCILGSHSHTTMMVPTHRQRKQYDHAPAPRAWPAATNLGCPRPDFECSPQLWCLSSYTTKNYRFKHVSLVRTATLICRTPVAGKETNMPMHQHEELGLLPQTWGVPTLVLNAPSSLGISPPRPPKSYFSNMNPWFTQPH